MTRLTLFFLSGACALTLGAAQPTIQHAKFTQRTHAGTLEAELQRVSGPAWLGYSVAAAKPGSNSCCWNGGQAGCQLEGGRGMRVGDTKPGVKLEGSSEIAVLLRVERGAINRVSVFSVDCPLDAGGLPLVWLTGVSAPESAEFLAAHTQHGTLVALAMQAGKEADAALIHQAREAIEGRRRSEALFWLAVRATAKSVGTISRAIEDDPDTEVKKQAVFALSQLPKDEGVPKLIEVARANRNPAVRKQAFFWLGQSDDPRAFRFLEETILH
jgi:hypothetical protein